MLCFMVVVISTGCSTYQLNTTGKAILTPLTVVRDVVDAPVVSLTNGCEYIADQSHAAKAPNANVGWNLKSGFNFNIGYDVSWLLFKSLSGVCGAVDYIVCRSIWPNFAYGVSPWLKEDMAWGDLYFPSTRVLWDDYAPLGPDYESEETYDYPPPGEYDYGDPQY